MQFKTQKNSYTLLERLGLLINSEIENDYKFLLPPKLNGSEAEKIIKRYSKKPSDDEIKSNLSNVSNLLLNVQDDCIFRCKYCVYSGNYAGERVHKKKRMSYRTAMKAVDFFFRYINKKDRSIKRRFIPIGLFGGEPLLEFGLIKNVIHYSEEQLIKKKLSDKFELHFSISTNGYLLNEEVTDFLAEKKVDIAVSLDGPEKEHDRFRVTKSGEGTWKVIMRNLNQLKNKHPVYYREHVSFLCTVHPLHNGDKIDDFFLNNSELFDTSRITFSSLKIRSLKEEEGKEIKRQRSEYKSSHLMRDSNFSKNFDEKKFVINTVKETSKLTGTCFPGGHKLFVSTNGDFHICERVTENFPIGNVREGYNYEKIREIIYSYNKGIVKNRCWECEVWLLCTACYASCIENNEIKFECPKEAILEDLSRYLSYKEAEYVQKNPSIDTVADYIDFLPER